MLIVSGWIRTDPAIRDRYVFKCADVVRQARAAQGCLDFAITADSIEPDRINIYERWDNDDNLAYFRGSGPSDDQTAQILEAHMAKYRISATESP